MTTEIFVFGSNLAGRHGKGAALHARNFHGAIYGQGVGLQGNSYAIPTKDQSLKSLSLFAINEYVRVFLAFVATNPSLNFNVTRVGCGLAGYTDAQISPMFVAAPINCKLPQGWRTNTLTEFKLIVAGGRDFDDFAMMSETADGLAKGEYANREVSIVTGMARGADALAYRFAMERGVVVYEFPADWDKFGKSAGYVRNREMGKFSDGLLAFWDGKSRGTANMISHMQAISKPVHVIKY